METPDMPFAEAQRGISPCGSARRFGPRDVEHHCHLEDAEQLNLVRRILGPTIRDDRAIIIRFRSARKESCASLRATVPANVPAAAAISGFVCQNLPGPTSLFPRERV
jgi:hypothetical protein